MKAEIINDPAKGDGFGIIKVDFGPEEDRPGPHEAVSLAIQQFPSKYYLRPPDLGRPATGERWTPGGGRPQHAPLEQSWEGQTLLLGVGPDIVDALTAKLHALTIFTASSSWPQDGVLPLRKNNLKISGPVIVIPQEPPISTVSDLEAEAAPVMAQDDLAGAAALPEPVADIVMPEPTALAQPWPGPAPTQYGPAGAPESLAAAETPSFKAGPREAGPAEPGTASGRRPPKPGLKTPPKPARINHAAETALPKASEAAESPRKKKPGGLIFLFIALIAVLALAGGGAAWWFLYLKKELAPFLEDGVAQGENGPAAPVSPSLTDGVDPAKALAEVRELLRRDAPPASLKQAYQRYEGLAGAEDAVFLLAESLAVNEPAMRIRYAAFLDPTDTRPCGTIIKDAVAAYQEYQKVRGSAYAEAEKRREELRQWAERQAPLGNGEAKKLLEYLKRSYEPDK